VQKNIILNVTDVDEKYIDLFYGFKNDKKFLHFMIASYLNGEVKIIDNKDRLSKYMFSILKKCITLRLEENTINWGRLVKQNFSDEIKQEIRNKYSSVVHKNLVEYIKNSNLKFNRIEKGYLLSSKERYEIYSKLIYQFNKYAYKSQDVMNDFSLCFIYNSYFADKKQERDKQNIELEYKLLIGFCSEVQSMRNLYLGGD
jgi:hypothetical protein